MNWLREFARRLNMLLHRRQFDADLEEEMRLHLDLRQEEQRQSGMADDDAYAAARRRFGNATYLREESHLVWGWSWLEHLVQDARYALRTMRKSPGFTAIAILTLALGIGANTALFSLTDQILLKTLPVPNPQQLVRLRSPGPSPGLARTDFDGQAGVFSYPMFKDLRERTTVFSGLVAWFHVDLNVSGRGSTQTVNGDLVSGNYFEALGVTPALGRVFSMSDETAPGANPVAVLSYGFWSRQFGEDSTFLNKVLTVNGAALTVVGVARKGFYGVQVGAAPDIFIPVTMKAQMMPVDILNLSDRESHWLPLLGRLKPGITRQRGEAALQPTYAALLHEDAKATKLSGSELSQFLAKPLQFTDGSQGQPILQNQAETPLFVLTAMVALVLLITCANLASLLVARGEVRQREIAVRLAMGAGRWRLVRQLVTESLLIGVAGGTAGFALASWSVNGLISAIPTEIGMTGLATELDFRVLCFALALTLLTSVLFGLTPAIRATRVDLQVRLREQGSNISEGRSNVLLRSVLIAGQVALTAVLLVCAGLLGHTLINLEHANLGMNPDHILQFSVEPNLNGASPTQTLAFADRARQEMGALPGIRSVTASVLPMFSDDSSGTNITPEGYVVGPDENTDVLYDYAGPNYFSTLGIPLIAGREFTESDTPASQKVVIINQTLARRFFAGRNPIGMHIAQGSGKPDMEIVGVVGDSKWYTPGSMIGPFLYEPYAQDPRLGQLCFYVRTEHDPLAMAAALRGVIERLDPNLPVNDMRILTEQVKNSMFSYRVVAVLSVSLALLAVLLAMLGLYGVLAYVVARRTREIGIRMALGGRSRDILWLVVRQGARLTVIGGTVGIVAALIATRWVASLLYGVTSRDPLTYVGVGLGLAVVSAAACYIPARRAVRVDPMIALRHE